VGDSVVVRGAGENPVLTQSKTNNELTTVGCACGKCERVYAEKDASNEALCGLAGEKLGAGG